MSDKLIEQYEKILLSNVWGKNRLLKVLGSRMESMLQELKAQAKPQYHEERQDLISVYVVLYHQHGVKRSIWESQLKKIRYSLKGRPVFLTELEAKSCISDNMLEGYVCLKLPKEAVMLNEGSYYIRESAIAKDSIESFSWCGGTYCFKNGVLEQNHE